MAEDLIIPSHASSKEEKYKSLIPQIHSLIKGEINLIANLANIAGALKEGLGFFWVGFYLTDSDDELVLGPFQGPVACSRIQKSKGVCGTCWQQGQPLIVPDVEKFPGHIACNASSRSEIVLPVFKSGKIIGVLDVDSDRPDAFDLIDKEYLEKITALIP